MSFWLTVALQAAQAAPDANTFDLADRSKQITLSLVTRCQGEASSSDIVVCGGSDQYRLPLPNERKPSERARGEAETGMAALTRPAPCGMFVGERRCSKMEAAEFGYGNGRDPITVVVKLAGKLIDPDAE